MKMKPPPASGRASALRVNIAATSNAHSQNMHHAEPDRGTRGDQKIDQLQQKSVSDWCPMDITWRISTSKYAIQSANTAIH
jgi:hypothetical protein